VHKATPARATGWNVPSYCGSRWGFAILRGSIIWPGRGFSSLSEVAPLAGNAIEELTKDLGPAPLAAYRSIDDGSQHVHRSPGSQRR
jgi:hypothetical protein